jgi:roadblock/LC7 domain-containing protein
MEVVAVTTIRDANEYQASYVGTDPLEGLDGVVVSVLAWPDGRTRHLVGLDGAVAADTGHFVASVKMVLETLLLTWSDVAKIEAAPLRIWAAQSGSYWLVGKGLRAWVLDRQGADVGAVLERLAASS